GGAEPLLESLRRLRGVGAGFERDDLHLEPCSDCGLHAPERRVLAGRVAVEAEPDPPAQARELPQLLARPRRPHRGADGLETGRAQLFHREPLLTGLVGERVPARSEAEPILAADLLSEPAPAQVRAGGAARDRIPETSLVVAGRLLEQGQEPLTPASLRVSL